MSNCPNDKTSIVISKPMRYISHVIKDTQSILGDGLVSVILFGSVLRKEFSENFSDVDMIIVVSDQTDDKFIQNVSERVKQLQEEYGIALSESDVIGGILSFMKRQTGMFVSCFICRESEILHANFHGIFSTNFILSEVIAPKRIVLNNIFSHAKTVFGEDILHRIQKLKITKLEVLKSLLMNLLLSVLSILLFPFDDNATKFAMEAVKWSIHASYYYINNDSATVRQGSTYFAERGICSQQIERLLQLRLNYAPDLRFTLFSPRAIIGIHHYAMSLRVSESVQITGGKQ